MALNSASGDVRIVEVGPRDGLQNEPRVLPTSDKVRFVEMLEAAGLKEIEVASFVSTKLVPQLADAEAVLAVLRPKPGVRYSALVPNQRGLERALAAGARAIALFTAASETFNQRNVGMTIEASLQAFRVMASQARAEGIWLRAYVSMAFVCPYEGVVAPEQVRAVIQPLMEMGIDEVSLGDTVGRASPEQVRALLDELAGLLPVEQTALHLHDTFGAALANVDAALQRGVRVFDSAAGGLGGCPFAPGAPGNLSTEDLVGHLAREGFRTGVDVDGVRRAGDYVREKLR